MGHEDRHHPNSLLKVCTNYMGRSGWSVKRCLHSRSTRGTRSQGKAYYKCRTTPLVRRLSCLNPSGEGGTRTKMLSSKWPRLRESRKVNSIIIWQGGQGHQTISRMPALCSTSMKDHSRSTKRTPAQDGWWPTPFRNKGHPSY